MDQMNKRHESHVSIDPNKLMVAMNLRGLSAAQLARVADVSPTTISAIMTRAGRTITVRSARRIGDALVRTPMLPGLADILAHEQSPPEQTIETGNNNRAPRDLPTFVGKLGGW
jgi:transcriptional regulator with XRE-family HTH domain